MNRKYSPEMIAAALEASKGRDKQIVVAMTFGLPEGSLRYWRKKAGLLKPHGRPPYARQREQRAVSISAVV